MQHETLVPVKGKTTSSPTSTEAGSIAYPVTLESFDIDGNNWRKVYSDGWVEQGGFSEPESLAGYGERTVEFRWAFSSLCVTVNCQPTSASCSGGDAGVYGIQNLTKNGFTFTRGSATTYTTGIYWIARGI